MVKPFFTFSVFRPYPFRTVPLEVCDLLTSHLVVFAQGSLLYRIPEMLYLNVSLYISTKVFGYLNLIQRLTEIPHLQFVSNTAKVKSMEFSHRSLSYPNRIVVGFRRNVFESTIRQMPEFQLNCMILASRVPDECNSVNGQGLVDGDEQLYMAYVLTSKGSFRSMV